MDAKAHWQRVYVSKSDAELSWHQAGRHLSMQLILEASNGGGAVIDVGGGSSTLVDELLKLSFERIAVLDISQAALDRSKSRLGNRAERVEWIAADITDAGQLGEFDVWHDRAVFHFLTEKNDRERYVRQCRRTLRIGGHLIMGTFGPHGPTRCSGLEVARYDAPSLATELGDSFSLLRQADETHITPWGTPQAFLYAAFRHTRS